VCSSGRHTASSSPAHNSLANVRASSRSPFARACVIPVSPGETTITSATRGSRIRTISHAEPVTSNATWSVGKRLSARTCKSSGELFTRPAERTFPFSQIAISQKSRCTSRPIARPTALTAAATAFLLEVDNDEQENRGQNDNDGYALAAQSGKSQGRPPKSTGSQPIVQNGLPLLRSPRKPLSRSADRKPRPGRNPHKMIFMRRQAGVCRRTLRATRSLSLIVRSVSLFGSDRAVLDDRFADGAVAGSRSSPSNSDCRWP
jgi:hypothetical protein